MRTLRTHIADDDLDLAAWLDLPAGDGPHPAVVLIHGSGPTDLEVENRYEAIRQAFTRAGIACLQWDKPGCGASRGNRRYLERHSSRVAEVQLALDFLRLRQEIDSSRIGVWGISEGAWIAAMSARACKDVACLILVSTPSSNLEHEAEYIARTNLSLEGYEPREIESYVDDIRQCFKLVAEGGPYEQFLSGSARIRANVFFQMTGWNRIVREEWEDGTLQENLLTDTRELLLHVRCPVLVIYGEKDSQVDWRRGIDIYTQTAAANPYVDITIRAFPDADHNLRSCSTGSLKETRSASGSAGYVPGYTDAMVEWLSAKLLRPGDVKA